MPSTIHFYLNDRCMITELPAGTLVLDFLRHHLRLTGTKEGCKEGDCGACTVLVGEAEGDQVRYQPMTSCLLPLGELHGKHLVTIEGLNRDRLTPVQQAIVDTGGTQCGFCTPGIVVSLTGLLMQEATPIDSERIKYALSGHLCRCTGYRSLKHTAELLQKAIPQTGVVALVESEVLPDYFRDIPEKLSALPAVEESQDGRAEPLLIAGGTDLYVQRGEEIPELPVLALNRRQALRGIQVRHDGALVIGPLTTFEDFARHPEVRRRIPCIEPAMHLIASWQIRTRATLGGNIVNASPIGDLAILLLALDAQLSIENNRGQRTVALRRFFLGYKQRDLRPGELLHKIILPPSPPGLRVDFEKVSKRKCLDIASVNSALCLSATDDVITECGLAMGGVAPIPLFLAKTSRYFCGKAVMPAVVRRGLELVQQEIAPISDIRGSTTYKRLLARQLLIAHFTKLFPNRLHVRDFYETH